MSDRHSDAPPALPTDEPCPTCPADDRDDRSLAMLSMEGPAVRDGVEDALEMLDAGDALGGTIQGLEAVADLLRGLQQSVVIAAETGEWGYLLLRLMRFFQDNDILEIDLPVAQEGLDRLAAVRFRHGKGHVAAHFGPAASAGEAILCARIDLLALLDRCFPEARAFQSLLAEAKEHFPRPITEGGEGSFDLLELLDRLGGDAVAEAAAALRRFPMAHLLGSLKAMFDEADTCRYVAELRQEAAQARLEAGVFAPAGVVPAGPSAVSGLPASARPDGPEAPYWLWWRGSRHRVGRGNGVRCWQLLAFMWPRSSATFDELQEEDGPWQDPVSPAAVATAVARLNASLPLGYPRRLATRGFCVLWEDFPAISAR